MSYTTQYYIFCYQWEKQQWMMAALQAEAQALLAATGEVPPGFPSQLIIIINKTKHQKISLILWITSSTNKQVFFPGLIILWFCDFKWQ